MPILRSDEDALIKAIISLPGQYGIYENRRLATKARRKAGGWVRTGLGGSSSARGSMSPKIKSLEGAYC